MNADAVTLRRRCDISCLPWRRRAASGGRATVVRAIVNGIADTSLASVVVSLTILHFHSLPTPAWGLQSSAQYGDEW